MNKQPFSFGSKPVKFDFSYNLSPIELVSPGFPISPDLVKTVGGAVQQASTAISKMLPASVTSFDVTPIVPLSEATIHVIDLAKTKAVALINSVLPAVVSSSHFKLLATGTESLLASNFVKYLGRHNIIKLISAIVACEQSTGNPGSYDSTTAEIPGASPDVKGLRSTRMGLLQLTNSNYMSYRAKLAHNDPHAIHVTNMAIKLIATVDPNAALELRNYTNWPARMTKGMNHWYLLPFELMLVEEQALSASKRLDGLLSPKNNSKLARLLNVIASTDSGKAAALFSLLHANGPSVYRPNKIYSFVGEAAKVATYVEEK